MLISQLVVMCLVSGKQPQSFIEIGDAVIGTGTLPALEANIGRGESVVRDEELHNDGWTYWKIRGRKDEMLFVYWEPANPPSKRTITRITIESFRNKSDRSASAVDPKLLGYWGKVQLGTSPSILKKRLTSLGAPKVSNAKEIEWRTRGLTITAEFSHEKLFSIAVDSIYLGLAQSMPMQ